jgi:hypothetical protein
MATILYWFLIKKNNYEFLHPEFIKKTKCKERWNEFDLT